MQVGTAEYQARLALDQLFADAQKASRVIQQQVKDQQVNIKPVVDSSAIANLAKSLGSNFGEAEKFAQALNLTAGQAGAAIARIRELEGVGATTAEKYRALKSEFGLTATQMFQLGTAAKVTAQQVSEQARALQNSSSAVAQLANTLGTSFGNAQKFAQSLGLTAGQASQAIAKIRELNSAGASGAEKYQVLSRELGLTANQISAVSNAAGGLGGLFAKLTGGAGGLQGVLAGIAGGATLAAFQALQSAIAGIITGLQNLIGTALQTAQQFNAAQSAVNSLGADGEEVAKAARNLSQELGGIVTSTDLLQSSYDVLSSKTASLVGNLSDAEVATKILDAAVKGAIGGFSDTNTVADALTSILNSYQLSAEDAAAVTDKLAATQNAGKITIDQYAAQIGRLAPIAAQAGVSLDELNGFIATATVSGLPVESTFAGIRQAISAILKPTEQAKDLAAQLGIEFNATALRTQGLSGILGQLNAAGADTQDNLATLFGSVEALAAIAPSTGAAFQTLQANIANSANSAGAAQKAFEAVAGNIENRLNKATNSLNESLLTLGQAIQPVQVALTELFAGILAEAVDGNEAFKVLEEASLRFAETLKENPQIIENLGNALGELAESLARLAALGLDAFAAFLASDQFNQFAASVGSIVEAVNLLLSAFNAISSAGAAVGQSLQIVVTTLFPLLDAVGELTNAFGTLFETAKQVGEAIGKLPIVQSIGDAIKQLEELARKVGILKEEPAPQAAATNPDEEFERGRPQPRPEPAPQQQRQQAPRPRPQPQENEIDRELRENEEAYRESQIRIAQLVANGRKTEQQARAENLAEERDFLNNRLNLNQRKAQEIRAAQEGATDPAKQKELAEQLKTIEGQIAQDRLAIAQKSADARQQAERQALEAIARANEEANAQITQSQNARIAAIRQAQLAGTKSAEEAEREIAAIQQASTDRNLQQKQRELAQIQALRRRGTISAEEAANRERQLSTEISEINLRRLEEELQARQRLIDKIEEQRQREEAIAGISQTQQETQVLTAQLNLEQRIDPRADFEEQARQRVALERAAQIEIGRIQEQALRDRLQRTQTALAELANLEQSGQISSSDAEDTRLRLIGEIASAERDLVRQQSENAQRIREEAEAAAQARIAAINRELDLTRTLADVRVGYNQIAVQGLQVQAALLSAQSGLIAAQGDLVQQRLKFELDSAEATGNGAKAEQARRNAIDAQIGTARQQAAINQKQVSLKLAQLAVETQIKQIQAEIALLEAQARVQEAIAEGKSAAQIAALQQVVGLRQMEIGAISQAANLQRQALQIEGQAQATRDQTQLEGLQEQRRREFADSTAAAGQGNAASRGAGYQAPTSLPTTSVAAQAQAPAPTISAPPTPAVQGAAFSEALKGANQPIVTELQGLRAEIARLAASPRSLTVQAPNPVQATGAVLNAVSKQAAGQARL